MGGEMLEQRANEREERLLEKHTKIEYVALNTQRTFLIVIKLF